MKYRILDITRTITRVGLSHPTGIDRVERAYIGAFLKVFPDEAVFLAKLSDGCFVLDAIDMERFVAADFGNSLDTFIGFKDVMRLKLSRPRRRAQSFIHKKAKWSAERNISTILNEKFPDGFDYTNVGHSNLTDPFLATLKPGGCDDIRIMVHDMIPLDFPEYCRPQTPQDFLRKMQAVAAHSDEVICNSEYTKSRVQTYFADWPNNVSYVVAPLGVESYFKAKKKAKPIPAHFTILGTIEPRKNHKLLLDVWEALSQQTSEAEMPILHIVGKRGWENGSFFERLDASHLLGHKIIEHNNLDDVALSDLLNNTRALLFPSFTEGYGLPALEALAMKVPVVCSDIPVFKELLGENAHLLPYENIELWVAKLLEIMRQGSKWTISEEKNLSNFIIPTWSAHFCHVFGEYKFK
ncbi:glycosyltransferase family 4 protein [Amylibacter sp. SFDW26]|uniref:glycosyltransferase family 4 protein n=1 Tax=Amylibacter sp. SFDW26 TaxID=2652722 RepID=UPI001261735F|nr:glycosyltransferase family 1 protein [Amylibacter sp. SFDW26]KAB7614546.1 glycosyltransferase family 4 protein [Amylibacter sp. SFDW26]